MGSVKAEQAKGCCKSNDRTAALSVYWQVLATTNGESWSAGVQNKVSRPHVRAPATDHDLDAVLSWRSLLICLAKNWS